MMLNLRVPSFQALVGNLSSPVSECDPPPTTQLLGHVITSIYRGQSSMYISHIKGRHLSNTFSREPNKSHIIASWKHLQMPTYMSDIDN